MKQKFSILITTKNRCKALRFTLESLMPLLERDDVVGLVCDDGSTDGTFVFLQEQYPRLRLFRNEKSRGLIYSRNLLLANTKTSYAISLDDDAHFVSKTPLEEIETYFKTHPRCAVVAFRIFWGLLPPTSAHNLQNSKQVKGFVGCGHAWRMDAWKAIPDYPDWFVFYGEESFAAFQLFKKDWEIHYVPEIFVHHRVDNRSRKKDKDYSLRMRRSFRSGWYVYFMFYPWRIIPKKLAYTGFIQFKNKTLKGDVTGTFAIFRAVCDVVVHLPKLLRQSNRLTLEELNRFETLPETQVYWNPEKENKE